MLYKKGISISKSIFAPKNHFYIQKKWFNQGKCEHFFHVQIFLIFFFFIIFLLIAFFFFLINFVVICMIKTFGLLLFLFTLIIPIFFFFLLIYYYLKGYPNILIKFYNLNYAIFTNK